MNKRKVIVYISGKYSGDIDANIQKAREMAITIWELGFTAFCPHLNTIHFEKSCRCTYADYLLGDLEILKRVNIVLMMTGWEESKGAMIEHEEAKLLQLPIVYNLEQLEAWYAEKPTVTV